MIVKNESEVILRCLKSVRPHIHSWAIVDTGSTDGTQEIIRDYLQGIPGELIEREWVDFSTNRNQALDLAKEKGCEYALIIDADEVLVAKNLPVLGAPGYYIGVVYGNTRYQRMALPRLDVGWEWRGVLHEALYQDTGLPTFSLPDVYVVVHTDGARSKLPDSVKYAQDAAILEEALVKEPDNLRYLFYLAQSYRDAGQLVNAIRAYYQRAQKGGWQEEVYISLLELAKLYDRLRYDVPIVRSAYLDAYQYRPTRAEALRYLAWYHANQGWKNLANLFHNEADKIPFPEDQLFVDVSCYKEET